MYNGVINIYKERGYTSADVVAKLRGILHQKKIGHTGTLDPEAEGVLPVCLGNATKLVERLTDKRKEYVCTMRLGVETDTEDMTGQVLRESPVDVSEEEVRAAIESFVGEYLQVPPMYSALKQGGKRLYELAREGVSVERPPRRVEIFSVDISSVTLPLAVFSVSCSRGTYIRSLCRDIGEKLGCGAAMEKLLRSKSGEFTLDTARRLSEVEELAGKGEADSAIIGIEHFYEELPAYTVRAGYGKLLDNGNPLGTFAFEEEPETSGECRIYDENGAFRAVYAWDAGKGHFMPVTMYGSTEQT
ncbi:MAG: tRNA pseudouridine(55) synthase TruB [Lachnospiraceae bacterium]|nr:tRNA pseudouridine(55) synthase TruB [Lachnospiraceae bacterium]